MGIKFDVPRHRMTYRPATPVWVELRCDEPGCEGRMVLDKQAPVRASYPQQFRHVCSACGSEEWVHGAVFPYVTHEEIVQS